MIDPTKFVKVPRTITQEQADCVGCEIKTYERIVAVAGLFVPLDLPESYSTTGGERSYDPTRDPTSRDYDFYK